MERILSQEEISELLSAVRDGDMEKELEPEQPAFERKVKGLDLVQQSRGAGRRRIGNLDVILDAYARNASISMTQELQRSVSVQRASVDPMQFDPFMLSLQGHVAIGIIRLDPLKHGGLIILDGPLSYYLIETRLGGWPGSETLTLDRPMTTIETNIVKSIIEASCTDLQRAFKPLTPLNPSLVRIEVDPRMVNIVPPETDIMVVKFTITTDNEPAGVLSLVIPYPSLDPLKKKLRERVEDISAASATTWADLFAAALPELEVEITAQSGELTMPIRQILNLKEGDILDLNYDPDSPLRILVEDKPKFLALSGVHNGKKAVRITGRTT